MKIVFGTPFLSHSGLLAIADTHIGIESHLAKSGFAVESQAKKIANEAVRLGHTLRARILVHLGDVKHTIGKSTYKENIEVMNFFNILAQQFEEIVVVKGNHDGGLSLPSFVKVCKSYAHKDVGFLHGHCYPEENLLHCRYIVCGHIHPCIKFIDGLGRLKAYRCWLVARVNKKFREKFGLKKAKKLFVMPSANNFVGMREINNPYLESFIFSWDYFSKKSSEFYLFDGTFLGRLEHVGAFESKKIKI